MSSKVCKRTLCVKNLPQPSDTLVSELFGPLGGVLHKVITAGDSNRKDILVEFESEELATKARTEMHGKVVDGTNLFVDYALLGQSSFTSPSKEKAQKQKVSVLDRIIRPGNVKSSKGEDKNGGAGSQSSRKEGASSDNPNNSSTSQQNLPFDDEIEQGQLIPAPNVVKKGKAGDGFQRHGGGHDKKNGKKSFNTQKGNHRGQHKGQKKLEIIKPKPDPARLLEQTAQFIPKEVSSLIKTNPELTEHPQLVKTVFELVQKKLESNTKDALSRTDSKSNHYDPSVKNKTKSRSRSRSRSPGPSYSRHLRSFSRDRNDPYYYSKPRGSRSRSSGQKRGWGPSRSRSRSFERRRDYSYSRDSYYDHYKNSYYKRSRSRSSPRKEYSPYRDRYPKREDERYDYKDRNRNRSHSRSRPRSQSRSRSWSRGGSQSRNDYHRYRNRSSRSRSHSRSVYDSYRKEDGGSSKARYVAKGGLVIEKKNVNRKLEGSYGRDGDGYARRDISRSRSVDRSRVRNSRSISRDRHREMDRYKYKDNRANKGNMGGNRKKKALDVRNESNIDKNSRNRGQNGDHKRSGRSDGANYAQKDKKELAKGSNPNESAGYLGMPNLQQIFSNNLLNYSNNAQGDLQTTDPNISLPSYLYPVHHGHTSIEHNNGPEANNAQKEGDKSDKNEEIEISIIENSTTENSNIDVGKTEGKADGDHKKEGFSDLSERASTDVDDKKAEANHSITNEFISKNKMQAFINYIIATGDIQGLKEKLKSVEKPKE